MKQQILALSVALGLLAAACKTNDSEEKVVGGVPVRANDPLARHTVAFVDMDEENEEFCTGVLIAENAVLTAAHCFREKRENPRLFFGTSIPQNENDRRLIPIKKHLPHPDFNLKSMEAYDRKIKKISDPSLIPDPGRPLNDLAIVWFAGKAPEGFKPAPIAKSFSDGVVSTVAAYGCLSTECEELSYRLRKIKMKHVRTFSSANLLVMFAGKNKGTCAGDSGGPDFIEGKDGPEVLSLVDTGPDNCEAGVSVETLLHPYQDWINSSLKSAQ